MRDLTPTETKNEFNCYNKASDTLERLYYKTILTPDRIKFKSKIAQLFNVQETEERLKSLFELQVDTALQFITGFPDGTYSFNGVEFSSDPQSKFYDEGWKEKLKQVAGDTLILFCDEMFGQPNIYVKKNSALMMSLENTMKAGMKKNENASSKNTVKTARRSPK